MQWFAVLLCHVLLLDLGFETNAIRNVQRKHRTKFLSSPSTQYLVKPTQIVVPIMIHFDKPLTDKLKLTYKSKTKRKLKASSHEILKRVVKYFDVLSSNYKIRFKLIDTKFLKNNTEIVVMDENGTKYLKSYCHWQGKKKVKNMFYSVLLTGLDLFYIDQKGREVRGSAARSYMGSMCKTERSCALVEWNPTDSGLLLAHEIAHSLGVPHDGPPNNRCSSVGHVMGAQYNPKHLATSWSSCSRVALDTYLRSKKSRCLHHHRRR